MLNIKGIYKKVIKESKASHMKHLFDNGTMTFDDIRNIFKSTFTGKIGFTNKVKRIPLSLTYKDGNFALANDTNTIKEPYSVDKVCSKCKCKGMMAEAVTNTMNTFMKALKNMEQTDLNSIFANGQNYFTFDLVVPPESCLKDYGNKCYIQFNKLNSYDTTFKNIAEDESGTKKINEFLKLDNSIRLNNNELSKDAIVRLKNSTSPDAVLKELSADLEKIVDGIGYKATINDFVRERYAKYIVNMALRKGIDLYHNSDFVKELIARLSYVSDHKPNRADLCAYAKRDGVDYKNPAYNELLSYLEDQAEETNIAIMEPIEKLATKAGILTIKCLIGMLAADPRKSCSKLMPELDETIRVMELDDGLTPEKIKCFRRTLQHLEAYQNGIPQEGLMMMHNGKISRIVGTIGKISEILKLIA